MGRRPWRATVQGVAKTELLNDWTTKSFNFTLKSTVVQYKSWNTRAGITWTGKKRREEEEGDGKAERSSAIKTEGNAAISGMPDGDENSHSHL